VSSNQLKRKRIAGFSSRKKTKLVFLKSCMEGIDKNAQSQNLWIFATNYLNMIDPPVYRPGRLSNQLDFS
jgi:ATP-dependent 26S proteasome regulatory subunit